MVRADDRLESVRRRATYHESVHVVAIYSLVIGTLIKGFIYASRWIFDVQYSNGGSTEAG
ncbi:MAG: hypothetical protein VYB39_01160 [Pseudomonadota bacterium]|nr:hypothetical protein [Pseudomonadota bacterium]